MKAAGRRVIQFGLLVGLVCVLEGCSIEKTDGNKVADLDFTIVEEKEVPDEFMTQIQEKKDADFKLTYEIEGNLYIARGYGEQETGGYSIAVKDVYLTKNAVCIATTLIGPKETDDVVKAPSYPYIVVKVASQNKNVLFE